MRLPITLLTEDRDVTAQPTLRGDVAVLVPAAGLGARLGPGEPKALRELSGASLLVHAIRRLCQAPSVGHVAVAAPVGRVDEVRAALEHEAPTRVTIEVVEGGATRQDSVAAALTAVPILYPIILVHDAARAFAPPDLVERVAAAVREGHPVVIPVLPLVDTIKHVDSSGHVTTTLERSELRAVQTPQGFQRDVLVAAHGGVGAAATDDAGLAEYIGVPVFCVLGAREAMKITDPIDFAVAETLLRRRFTDLG